MAFYVYFLAYFLTYCRDLEDLPSVLFHLK